jgi:hypothetical protein
MQKIRIDEVDVILDELGENQGKIIISGYDTHNYSYFWGAMGGDLKSFLVRINSPYFADKLLGSRSCHTFDAKKTFANLRKHIREEMGLPFYEHVEFQKSMRETLNDFQRQCEEYGQEFFVHSFDSNFVNRLNFYDIKDNWERKRIESDFKEISEVWHFTGTKPSNQYQFLVKLHSKIKRVLKKQIKKDEKGN